jgi:hypothetical protein
MADTTNPFENDGDWVRANLHTHTTTSDGTLSPGETVERYRAEGYGVLALTDHHAMNDVAGLSDDRMLVVSGMEYHPPMKAARRGLHLVAIGLPDGFAFGKATLRSPNRSIRAVADAGGLTILAHPYWCGMEFADFRRLEGLAAMEVWNSVCQCASDQGANEHEWAMALDRGMWLPAVGSDDTHGYNWPGPGDRFQGWTWLRMRERTVEGVLAAIRTGASYVSCGPTIHHFGVVGGQVVVRCSPVRKIVLRGGPALGARRLAEPGKAVRSFRIPTPAWRFVRAAVTDARGRQAWTQPVRLGE